MVNPNDPNSESEGIPSSNPSSDPSSGDPSADSGPISDELFDSLSELLGDSPTTDEPASLPDLDLWSEPPAETTSTPAENIDVPVEEPTLIQFDTDGGDTAAADELSAIEDSLSVDVPSIPAIDLTADAPSVSEDISEEQLSESWEVESTAAFTSDATSGLNVDLPDELSSFSPEINDPLIGDVPTIEETVSSDRSEATSDPWVDPSLAEPTPVEPFVPEIEEPTIIQVPESSDATPLEDLSAAVPPLDEEPQDLWADPASTDVGDIEPDVALDDATLEPVMPMVGDVESPDLGLETPFPELQSDWVGEETPVSDPLNVSPPISDDDLGDEPPSLVIEASFDEATVDSPQEPVASTWVAGGSVEENVSEPIASMETDSTDVPAEEPPIVSVPDDMGEEAELSSSSAVDPGISSPEPLGASEPEVVPAPIPEPVSRASAAPAMSAPSASRSSTGAASTLSDKLPLNRYQTVGLLVALSTLGTITYLGVTGNQQDSTQSVPSISTPSVLPEAGNTNQSSGEQPLVGTAVTPPSNGAASPSTTADATNQSPSGQTAVVPQSPTGAIGGIDTPEVVPSQLDISDVPQDHWAYPFIAKLHAQGVIPDYPDGTFQPDKPVTRAELAAQIQRAFVNEPGQRALTFSDISADYWAIQGIEGAVDKKFMSGYPEGDFRPDKLVPRYEALVALVSGLELDVPSSPEASLGRFQDQGQLPNWSKGKIAASTQGGMVVNHPDLGLLNPEANATRAEVAVMIYQALVKTGRLEPIDSDYVVDPEVDPEG